MSAKSTYALLTLIAAIAAGGCERPHSQEADSAGKQSEPPLVAQTSQLTAVHGSPALSGVATIVNPDALLQIDADLRAATISADFSRGTLGRYKSTTALSRQTIENAERQAGTDGTQKNLLETRLRHTWGEDAPFLDAEHRQKLVAALTAGTEAIVRLDFPDLTDGTPNNVRVAPLAGGSPVPVKTLWVAPSGNQSMPGVSYFGLIDAGPGLRAGDRARLLADSPHGATGVVIPSAAIVVYAGQSWCFIETAPGKYERRAVALDLPISDGYLVSGGFTTDMRVVVRGASLLLSREAGPGEVDDDDGPAKKPADKDGEAEKPAAEKTSDTQDKPAQPSAVAVDHGASVAPNTDHD